MSNQSVAAQKAAGDRGRFGELDRSENRVRLAPAPMASTTHDWLADQFGAFESGYTDEDVQDFADTFRTLLDDDPGNDNLDLVCVWATYDDSGFGGDSELLMRDTDTGMGYRLPDSLVEYLSGTPGATVGRVLLGEPIGFDPTLARYDDGANFAVTDRVANGDEDFENSEAQAAYDDQWGTR